MNLKKLILEMREKEGSYIPFKVIIVFFVRKIR